MQNHDPNAPGDPSESLKSTPLSRLASTIVAFVVFILAWFGIAGRINWIQGWTFLFIFILFVSILLLRMSRLNPDLVRERNRPASDAEPWDQVVMRIYTVLLFVLLILSALDSGRFGWSDVPLLVQLTGWALLLIAGGIIWHVMMINAYLSSWARIQEDRDQVVIKKGLYKYIRHPMYLGIILSFLGLPFVLASWWATLPGVIIIGLFVYRTFREDRMLLEGLPGYMEYKEEVKHRLLPGIW